MEPKTGEARRGRSSKSVGLPWTSFVGRGADLAALDGLFRGHRLITVVGPPGVGKTRLAAEYARRHAADFRDDLGAGVWIADLTDATSLSAVCGVVGQALDVASTSGGEGVAQRLGEALAARGDTLLVLDNFEQAVALALPTVGAWLAQAPRARFLVTSREPLRLSAEQLLELGPLSLPSRSADVADSEAGALFLERARAVSAGFTLTPRERRNVTALVRRLDGIPLAIELCAPRLRVLSTSELVESLARGFDALAAAPGDWPARHATLRVAIDASWSSLTPWEQAALSQCSVFRGGFTREAAAEVLDLSAHPDALGITDVLQSLRDRSLLGRSDAPRGPAGARFTLLASIRAYAREKLAASGAEAAALERHARYYAGRAAAWRPMVHSASWLSARTLLTAELDNLVALHQRALETASSGPCTRDVERALDVALALHPVLLRRGPLALDLELLGAAIDAAGAVLVDPTRLARALAARSFVLVSLGNLVEAAADCERAHGLGAADAEAEVLVETGFVRWLSRRESGEVEDARQLFQRAVAAGEGRDRHSVGQALKLLGGLSTSLGEDPEARDCFARAIAVHRAAGDAPSEAEVLLEVGVLEIDRGRYPAGREHCERALAIHRKARDRRHQAFALGVLAAAEQGSGDLGAAEKLYDEALRARAVCPRRSLAWLRGYVGTLYYLTDRFAEARASYLEALDLLREGDATASLSYPLGAVFFAFFGALDATEGRIEEARAALDTAAKDWGRGSAYVGLTAELCRGHVDLALAREASARGDPTAARAHVAAARARLAGLPEPVGERYYDIRLARRMLETALTRAPVLEAAPPAPLAAAAAPAPPNLDEDLVVSRSGGWFHVPRGERVDLRARGAHMRLVSLLAAERLRAPGEVVPVGVLFDRAWPGERIDPDLAARRVYRAVWTLRQRGLDAFLLRRDGGYLFDPAILLCVVDDTAVPA